MSHRRWMGAVQLGLGCALMAFAAEPVQVEPQRMPRLGTVDERYQSYNVEMVEVTGGRFWAPYRSAGVAEKATDARQAVPGIDPSAFRMRQPIDLSNRRLRRLAAALGPAYLRVSGTWANSTYFHDADTPPPAAPPPGFGGVLTRAEWRGVIDFARAVDARIVTSFAISSGVRDAQGVWTSIEAKKLLSFTAASGGSIAAAEMFNEPTFAAMGGAPKGYDAAAYARDFRVFQEFIRKQAPDLLILGPGSVGEGGPMGKMSTMKSADLLVATGRGVDAFSYHFYGGVSKRCGGAGSAMQTTPKAALSEEWLARTDRDEAFYASLRDRFEPGKPIWLTETGETACGGNPWASSFLDSFRYLEQLGRLAKRGVQVVAHNTLAASDYGLIDEETLTPRPNYWAAWLWRRLMGRTVLDAGTPAEGDLHVYAHCLRGHPGGVALLAVHTGRDSDAELALPAKAERYTLSAVSGLEGNSVALNGKELKLGSGDTLPKVSGVRVPAGRVKLAPATISFFAVPAADNASCR